MGRLNYFFIFISLSLTTLLSCGASIKIYPLANEDDEVVKQFCENSKLTTKSKYSKFILKFKKACYSNDINNAWAMLSASSKNLFNNLAKIVDMKSGKQMLKSAILPSYVDNRKKLKFTLKSLFFFPNGIQSIEAGERKNNLMEFRIVSKDNRYKPLYVKKENNKFSIVVSDIKRLTFEEE